MSGPGSTRSIQLARLADQLRTAGGGNDGTVVGKCGRGMKLPRPEVVFDAWQGRMARAVEAHASRGVMVFALSELGAPAGQLWLKADDSLRTASLGRHSSCELFLPGPPALSLRHLLVVVRGGGPGLRCRVSDLRSEAGFETEAGVPLSSVLFNGMAVLAVPGSWLFFIPTGEALPWDKAAKDPWRTLPERVLVSGDEWRARDRVLPARVVGTGTCVVALGRAPVSEHLPLVEEGEEVEGQLVLEVNGQRLAANVGAKALDRGILIGRDPRCLGAGLSMPIEVSRVHAVVFRDGTEVFMADAGSKNGIVSERRLPKGMAMVSGAPHVLGRELVATWFPGGAPLASPAPL